ncbi:MAG: BglG family transcription antiterminator [Cetobacterium sp.]
MTKRFIEILRCVVKYNGKISYKLLSEILSINERSIRYDIDNINEILNTNNFELIQKIKKSQISYDNLELLSQIIHFFINSIDVTEYKEEIVLFKILFLGKINSKSLEDEIKISKTSVKNILKSTREKLKINNLELNIETHKGLFLDGTEENIRNAQLKFILTYYKDPYLMKIIDNHYTGLNKIKIELFLTTIIETMNQVLSDEPYKILYFYILIMINRLKYNKKLEKIQNMNFFEKLKEHEVIKIFSNILIDEYGVKIDLNETIKLTDYFLGSHFYYKDNSSYKFWIEIDLLALEIVKDFSKNIGVNLLKDKILLNGIINHLKPTIYRLKNNQTLENSILNDFLKCYNSIFIITKKSIKPLQNFIEVEVTNDEVAFLGVYFKAALDRVNKLENRKNNILLVCSSGYGVSKLLSQQLSENFDIKIVEIIPVYKLKNYNLNNIDLIIGTIDITEIELQKPSITINSLLLDSDLTLLENIGLNKRKTKILLSDLLNIFKKNGSIKNENTLIEDLNSLINDILIDDISDNELKLSDILEDILLDVDIFEWEEAVRLAGNIMIQKEICNLNYVDSMVEKIKEFGSYMVSNNKVALPHSKNNNNVFKSKMVLLHFKNEIIFPDKIPVKAMLAFTSEDQNNHLGALSNFLDLVNNYNFLEKLDKAPTKKNIIDNIKKYEFLSNLGKQKIY